MAQKKQKEEAPKDMDTLDSAIAEQKKEKLILGSRSGDEIIGQDIITTSSFEFDQRLGGGFRGSSWARFYADPECGKTSLSLCWGRNWQDHYENGFVVYFNAEGRLTKDIIDRSGIDTSKEKFRIVDGNSYEAILNIMESCVTGNKENRKYFMIMDSTDAMERALDKGKSFGDSEKIAGGAAILALAQRRLSIITNLSGHFIFICSQIRDKMKSGPGMTVARGPSGGNAVKFASSLTAEIKKPWGKRFIRENPSDDKSRIIGKLAEIRLEKTPNETSGSTVFYPVKYGLKGGIWRAYEAVMVAEACQIVKGTGWYELEESVYADIEKQGIKVPQKVQGRKGLRDMFDNNPDLVNYIFDKAKIIYSPELWIEAPDEG